MTPELSIRIRSVGVAAPSAVVLKTRRPGMSFVPGVPSTCDKIEAESVYPTPSYPENRKIPSQSSFCILVGAAKVPRDLSKNKIPVSAAVSVECRTSIAPFGAVPISDAMVKLALLTGAVSPETIRPSAVTTNGLASGLVVSSTNKALPVPSCVMRKAALVLSVTLMMALPLNVDVPVTPRVVVEVRLNALTARPAVRLATETCLVAVPWTIGKTSVPARGVVLAGRALILTSAMNYSVRIRPLASVTRLSTDSVIRLLCTWALA